MVEVDKTLSSVLVLVSIGALIIITIFLLGVIKSNLTQSLNSTTENILSDNGTTIILTSTPSSKVSAVTKNRTWLSFDGNKDYIDLTPNVFKSYITNSTNTTYNFWINNTEEVFVGTVFIALHGNNNNGSFIKISIRNNGNNISILENGTSTTQSNETVPISKWAMVTIIKEGPIISNVYINNAEKSISHITSIATINTNVTFIGNSNSQVVVGSLDEFRIYNTSLTQSEIASIFNNGRKRNISILGTSNDANQVLYLPMNENSGSTVYDLSGQSNNGTIINATYGNDDINIPLVDDIDYTQTADTFTLINDFYSWSGIVASYNILVESTQITAISSMISQFGTYPILVGLVGTIIFLGLVIFFLIKGFSPRI